MGLLEKFSLWLSGGKREVTVLVLGLDNSGKSSVLKSLRPVDPKRHDFNETVLPTVGAQKDHFQSGGIQFSAWDVGGSRRHRALWERHYRATDAIIYVVDAADHLRLVVSREELELVLAHPDINGRKIPILVLANKSDKPDALAAYQVATALGLERIIEKPWHICSSSATAGTGLADGVSWLARQLREIPSSSS